MKRRTSQNLILLFCSTFAGLAGAEALLRLLSSPSENSAARIWKLELPPIRVVPTVPSERFDRSQWYKNLVVRGEQITVGDLWGYHREDPLLTYTPQENVTSVNGWWQSNNLGARRRSPTSPDKPPGITRLLVFGDSYSNCSRVPQEETWPSFLEQNAEGVEVVNLGVDGYSMGQSFLRYGLIRNRAAFDVVLLVFVPSVDLWREINVIRPLKEPWDNYRVMSRFIVHEGELHLIRPLYGGGSELYEKNSERLSSELREHLRQYDSFYFEELHQPSWLIKSCFLAKLTARVGTTAKKRRLSTDIRKPGSEAMRIAKEIFRGMSEDVADAGGSFRLVFLPTEADILALRKDRAFARGWRGMVSWLCHEELLCVDLGEDFATVDPGLLDHGYDGTHHGPRTNQLIADLLARRLEEDKIVPRVAQAMR